MEIGNAQQCMSEIPVIHNIMTVTSQFNKLAIHVSDTACNWSGWLFPRICHSHHRQRVQYSGCKGLCQCACNVWARNIKLLHCIFLVLHIFMIISDVGLSVSPNAPNCPVSVFFPKINQITIFLRFFDNYMVSSEFLHA